MEDVITKGRKNNRYVMYVNQLSHMKYSFKELYNRLLDFYPEDSDIDFAMILHDKDKNKDGEEVAPHVHVSLYSRNGLTKDELMNVFSDDNFAHFEYMRNKDTSFIYLIHQTVGAIKEQKYPYDVDDVLSNFDYADFVSKRLSNRSNANSKLVTIINAISDGELSKDDVLSNPQLSRLYALHKRRFDDAFQVREEVIKHERKYEGRENLL